MGVMPPVTTKDIGDILGTFMVSNKIQLGKVSRILDTQQFRVIFCTQIKMIFLDDYTNGIVDIIGMPRKNNVGVTQA